MAQIKGQKARHKELYMRYIVTVKAALRDTANSLSAYAALSRQLNNNQQALIQEQRSCHLTKSRYRHGLTDEVTITQCHIRVGELRLIISQNKLEKMLAIVRLYQELEEAIVGIDNAKIIRTWRLALTCTFLFLFTWYMEVPERNWTLVTIWFVMYEYSTVGGVLTKSKLRFLGTFLSAVYGTIVVYFGGNNPILDIMALFPGLFIYTYFFMGNDKTYVGTIGAVTLTLILLNYNDLDTALMRVLNVFIWIIARC